MPTRNRDGSHIRLPTFESPVDPAQLTEEDLSKRQSLTYLDDDIPPTPPSKTSINLRRAQESRRSADTISDQSTPTIGLFGHRGMPRFETTPSNIYSMYGSLESTPDTSFAVDQKYSPSVYLSPNTSACPWNSSTPKASLNFCFSSMEGY